MESKERRLPTLLGNVGLRAAWKLGAREARKCDLDSSSFAVGDGSEQGDGWVELNSEFCKGSRPYDKFNINSIEKEKKLLPELASMRAPADVPEVQTLCLRRAQGRGSPGRFRTSPSWTARVHTDKK